MKRALCLMLLAPAMAAGQVNYPAETEARRMPELKTSGSVLIKDGTLLTVTRGNLVGYDLLIRDGKIAHIAQEIAPPAGVPVVDARGKFVTPGLVDAHSHRASDDTNEFASAITSETRIRDVLNANDLSNYYALASGITTSLVLHGSANPIGGQSLVVKHKWMRPTHEIVFPGAPQFIKFALGENPKGDPSSENIRFPLTRQGVEAVIRRAFADARDYMRRWDDYKPSGSKEAPPRRDLRLEGIADILRGKTWVHCHSYRQDEMLMMVRLSQELGFKLVLQHALEGYKIAPELAKANVPVSIFGGGYGYKLEVIDSTPMAAAILDKAGVNVSINTDTSSGSVPLTQDAARTLRYGVPEQRALRMITMNPASQLGVETRVGSLEPGKDGDIAIWQGHPLSAYTKCVMTLIEGEVFFQRRDAFGVDATGRAQQTLTVNTHDPAAQPVLKAARSYLIAGGTVHPVSGPTQRNSNVLIEDGRVVAVGPGVRGGSGTVTVDARGLHVFPGFIDAGSRMGLDEIGQIPQALDARENGDFKPDLRAIHSTNPDSMHLPKATTHGVTTVMITPTGGTFAGQSAVIDTFGTSTEDLAIHPLAGLMMTVPSGVSASMRDTASPEEFTRMQNDARDRIRRVDEAIEAAKRYLDAKDAGEAIATDVKYEALRPYLRGERPTFFVASTAASIRSAVAFARRHGLKPVIFGGAEAWKVAKLLKDQNVPVALTGPSVSCAGSNAPSDELDPYDAPFVAAELLRRQGVKFCIMSNSMDGSYNLPNQVGRTVAFGLPWDAGIRAITLDAAEILGIGDRYGSLQPGKIANVVVTDGDPLELSTQVRYAFVRGRAVPLESRYTALYREYMGRLR